MKRTVCRLSLCGIAVIAAAAVCAQSTGGPYTLRKQVIAGGGSRAVGTPYVATVTVSESVASVVQSGGALRLTGGFHGARAGSTPLPPRIFCDGFEAVACP